MRNLFAHHIMVLIVILSSITITAYSYATTDKIADAFVKTTTYIDTVCTSPKFTLLAPVRNKIKQLITTKKYSAYKVFLTDIVEYIDQIIPGCYNPAYKITSLTDLSLVRTEGIEANDWAGLQPPSSGYFRRFYHVYYSRKGKDLQNPVLLFHIPKEAGCLMGIWRGPTYNDMFYSNDAGKTWERWKTGNTGCIPATHVKIIPSPENSLGTKHLTEYLNSPFVGLHLGTKAMPTKDLCIDLIYSADNAQYLERKICEQLNSSFTQTTADGITQSFGFDFGSQAHADRWSEVTSNQGAQ